MKRIWLVIILLLALIFIFFSFAESEGKTLIKQGVLVSVSLSGESSMILTFNDGTVITVEESNTVDALEMIDYLNNWIGTEMVLEYTYYYDINGYEINSVSYPA